MCGVNYLSIHQPTGCFAAVEVWEWNGISNFIPHYMMDVITYPCRGLKLVWAPEVLQYQYQVGHSI